MPNWVRNQFTIRGPQEDLMKFVEDVKGDEPFDFNKLIPMPPELNVTSGSNEKEKMLFFLSDRLTMPEEDILQRNFDDVLRRHNIKEGTTVKCCFNNIERILESLKNLVSRCDFNWDKFYDEGMCYSRNMAEYGYTTWYNWCVDVWGTKWNACDSVVSVNEDHVEVMFNTAWSMPEGIFEAIAEKYLTLSIDGVFADEDIGSNCGTFTIVDGEFTIDDLSGNTEFACGVWGMEPETWDNDSEDF